MTEIKAQEGYWLTQKTLANEDSRTFAKKIFTPNKEIWTEWSDEQKVEWEEAHPAPSPDDVNSDYVSDADALAELKEVLGNE